MSMGVNIYKDDDGKFPPTGDMIFTGAVAVVPHDTNLINPTVALWIGGTGNVVVTMANGVDVTFTAVPAGYRLNASVVRVKATLTTATNIIALYP